MSAFSRITLILAAMVGSLMAFAAPASAQATRTWISGVGDDVNPCSRTAPCKTFQGAISKTAAGGEINCLDPGGFGAVTITKSISLICDTTESGVLVAATNGIIINGTGIIVQISGFDLEGLGQTGVSGVNGIYFLNGASLTVRNSKIRGFRNGYGINFTPQSSNAQLFVDNVIISESGIASNTLTGGLLVAPAAGFTARATITRSQIFNNENSGFRADTIGIVGSVINATIDSSVISGNTTGILAKAPASTGTIKLLVTRSTVDENGVGIVANGTGTTVRVGDTAISNNTTGLLVLASPMLGSFGTNMLVGNGTDGAFNATLVPLK